MDEIEYKSAIRMIDNLYKEFYKSDEYRHQFKNTNAKFENISSYIDRLEKIFKKIQNNPIYINRIKQLFYDKYIIKKENIPNKNQNQTRYKRKRKNEEQLNLIHQEQVINDQKASLDTWLDYFISKESDHIPMWAKFWTFQGMIKLGTYNKISMQYNKREKNNTGVFAELNKEALNMAIQYLRKMLNKEKIEDKDLELLVKSGSFKKIYEIMLRKTKKETIDIYDGIWIKYNQGSNPLPLLSSIQGFNTDWCITGAATAYKQLSQGDFYIYYTKNNQGEYKVPRLAIRMENDDIIREICGVADKQNIEENFEKIIKDKIKNFKDKDEFLYGINQLEFLTYIHQKWLKDEELTKEELMFLYEINNDIVGVVPKRDPRINEILNNRNKREDLSFIFNCREDEIAIDEYELYDNPTRIVCLYNNLTFDDEKVNFPKLLFIKGNIIGNYLKDANGFKSLRRIGGDVNLDSLIDAKGFKNLISIGGSINCPNLKTSIGFENLVSIGNNAYFPELIDTLGFNNLKIIGLKSFYPKYAEAYFPCVTNAKGMENLEIVKGSFIFPYLNSLKNFISLKEIRSEAYLLSLESIKNLDKICINSCGGKLIINEKLQEEYNNLISLKTHK